MNCLTISSLNSQTLKPTLLSSSPAPVTATPATKVDNNNSSSSLPQQQPLSFFLRHNSSKLSLSSSSFSSPTPATSPGQQQHQLHRELQQHPATTLAVFSSSGKAATN